MERRVGVSLEAAPGSATRGAVIPMISRVAASSSRNQPRVVAGAVTVGEEGKPDAQEEATALRGTTC